MSHRYDVVVVGAGTTGAGTTGSGALGAGGAGSGFSNFFWGTTIGVLIGIGAIVVSSNQSGTFHC